MSQSKPVRANTRDSLLKAKVVLGNSSREQLVSEARSWVKESQKESKRWGKMFGS